VDVMAYILTEQACRRQDDDPTDVRNAVRINSDALSKEDTMAQR
jgi:hypothetical protein